MLVTLLALGAGLAVTLATNGLEVVFQTTVNALVVTAILALGAVGLSIVKATTGVLNFAHGDLLTLGAYSALAVQAATAMPTLVMLPAAVLVAAGVGITSERLLWVPLRKNKASAFELLMTAIGLAFLLRYGLQFVFGSEHRRLDGDVTATVDLVFGSKIGADAGLAVLVAAVALVGTFLLLRGTKVGKDMRALADNPELAAVAGISVDRTRYIAWGLSAGLAGLAGGLYGWSVGQVRPDLGFDLLLPIFAAAVVGGMRDPRGAVLGAFLVALVQEWSTLFIPPGWKLAAGFAVLLLVLLARPSGLLADATERR